VTRRTSPIAAAGLTAIVLSAMTAWGRANDVRHFARLALETLSGPLLLALVFFGHEPKALLVATLPLLVPALLMACAYRTKRRRRRWLWAMAAGAVWYWVGRELILTPPWVSSD
jgi:hypothetical protein